MERPHGDGSSAGGGNGAMVPATGSMVPSTGITGVEVSQTENPAGFAPTPMMVHMVHEQIFYQPVQACLVLPVCPKQFDLY